MQILVVSLFELEQFLEILLWISLPIFVLSIVVATWMHYHKRKIAREEDRDESFPALDRFLQSIEAEGASPYQGMLWLKQKYELFKEQTDDRFGKLQEKFCILQDEYNELQEEHFRMVQIHEERLRMIEGLEERVRQSEQRAGVLTGKLETGSRLLIQAHQELNRLLAGERQPGSHLQEAIANPVNDHRIVGWIESPSVDLDQKLEPVA